jgi:PIN domain nuclease of toxin-antitoxin system
VARVNQFITDTHPLIWHLISDRRLSKSASQAFNDADKGLAQVLIPGIVLVEMVYLVEKGVLIQSRLEQVLTSLSVTGGSYAVAPLDQDVVRAMLEKVPWSAVPELADRIIAATAVALNLPLLSKDPHHRDAEIVQIIW